jgi:hypothetical protein
MSEIFEIIDFKQRAETITLPKYDKKLLSYPIILEIFSEIDQVEEQHLTLGALLLQGWLNIPQTKFNYDKTDMEFLLKKFNQAFNEDLSYEEINDLSLYFGGGIGVTAMLHFLHPNGYPIHKPEIDKNLYGAKASTSQWKKQYIWQYIQGCQSLSDDLYGSDKQLKKCVNIVNTKLKRAGYNYLVGKMRAIEMCLTYGNEDYKN